jgi:hypothetical protein
LRPCRWRRWSPRVTTQSWQPETSGCDDGDGGEEVPGETVVACRDAAPVFHAAEHALDDVAPAVGPAVQWVRLAARAGGGNDDLGALGFQALSEMVRVIGLVGQQTVRRGDVIEQGGRDADVGDVAGRQDEADRLALSVGQSVDLAAPPAT